MLYNPVMQCSRLLQIIHSKWVCNRFIVRSLKSLFIDRSTCGVVSHYNTLHKLCIFIIRNRLRCRIKQIWIFIEHSGNNRSNLICRNMIIAQVNFLFHIFHTAEQFILCPFNITCGCLLIKGHRRHSIVLRRSQTSLLINELAHVITICDCDFHFFTLNFVCYDVLFCRRLHVRKPKSASQHKYKY